MRLAWIVPNADPRVASFRYRCLIPAWALQQIGHDSTIFVEARPDPSEFDALIVVKQAGGQLHDVARAFRALGKPVFLDLCDNIFVPGYAQRRGPELSAETANTMPVVATYLESLEPLRDVMVIDDWRAGIEAYLFDPDIANEHLAQAQPILAQQFNIEAIGRQWNAILGAGQVEMSRPSAYWQPAAQMA